MAPHAFFLNHSLTYRRDVFFFGLLALLAGIGMAAALQHPGYTDAYYYFNGGQRLVQGKGLTDAAIWTYIGAPAGLPIPSHLYWMPLTSLVAAGGMALGGPTFDGAQILFVLLYVGLALVGFGLGAVLGQSRRVAWIAGLLTAFSGLFMPYWTTTDSFALYGFVGALCLVTMGLGRRSGKARWFILSGALAALAHLSRADGVLLIGVLLVVAAWPVKYRQIEDSDKTGAIPLTLPVGRKDPVLPFPSLRGEGAGVRGIAPYLTVFSMKGVLFGLATYLLVMTPWFVRNLNVAGSILPVGGTQTAWMLSYAEIANYPPGANLRRFLDSGMSTILASRWEAFSLNFQTFIVVEGLVVLTPFMLIALWKRRRDPLLSGFWLYALGLHAAMTLVFALISEQGGLFHSASALVPFWAALGVIGLDDVLSWLAPRRRWRLSEAKAFFGASLVAWAVFFSVRTFTGKAPGWNAAGGYFQFVAAHLPSDAVVMINDPSALYYFTGLPGIVVPNNPPDVIPELARRYGVNYVVLDHGATLPMIDLAKGKHIPPFLTAIYADNDIRIYHIESQ